MSPLAERYYRSWQAGQAVEVLERFLAGYPSLNAVQLVEVLLVDQMLEWQSGTGPSIEQYLQRFPVVSDRGQAVLELVYGEMRAARALGLTVNVDAYVARFPELAEPLRRQMEVSAWLVDEANDPNP